ncbi:MAG: hypothetical protein QOC79_2341, partial [Actinomycetota bacterium]|nr:hypothetical protein [Actinomycetota bacterium]
MQVHHALQICRTGARRAEDDERRGLAARRRRDTLADRFHARRAVDGFEVGPTVARVGFQVVAL